MVDLSVKFTSHISFIFPKLNDEYNIPDIRYDYLPCLMQLTPEVFPFIRFH